MAIWDGGHVKVGISPPQHSAVQCSRYKYNYDNHEIDILKKTFLSDNPVLGCTGGWATRYIGT